MLRKEKAETMLNVERECRMKPLLATIQYSKEKNINVSDNERKEKIMAFGRVRNLMESDLRTVFFMNLVARHLVRSRQIKASVFDDDTFIIMFTRNHVFILREHFFMIQFRCERAGDCRI